MPKNASRKSVTAGMMAAISRQSTIRGDDESR
jgi:hypothetical protein